MISNGVWCKKYKDLRSTCINIHKNQTWKVNFFLNKVFAIVAVKIGKKKLKRMILLEMLFEENDFACYDLAWSVIGKNNFASYRCRQILSELRTSITVH